MQNLITLAATALTTAATIAQGISVGDGKYAVAAIL